LPPRVMTDASPKPLNWIRCGGGEGDGDGEGDGEGDAAPGAGEAAVDGFIGVPDGAGDGCACAAFAPANATTTNAAIDKSFFNILPLGVSFGHARSLSLKR